jgi:hypothetical protein
MLFLGVLMNQMLLTFTRKEKKERLFGIPTKSSAETAELAI